MRLKSSRRPARRTAPAILPLEPRLLMAATTIDATAQEAVINPIPSFSSTDTRYQSIPLDAYFEDPNVPGTLVTFYTSKGDILVSLTDAATPLEVANFLSYVADGAYNGTVFHRSALDAQSNPNATPPVVVPISNTNRAGIIQGGGYTLGNGGLDPIASTGAVADEYTTETYNNIAGTIAGAKTGLADSTSNEWYFNVSDNPGLDGAQQQRDANNNVVAGPDTGYTVFGKVLSGLNVITAIASLPTADVNTADGSTTPAPITGLTQTQLNAGAPVAGTNLVYVNDVVSQPGTTYTVTSSDQTLVDPSVSNGKLSFKYGATLTGTAIVTITATDVYDGSHVTESFAVTVPSASATTAAPITTADTATAVAASSTSSPGPALTIYPLSNDTVGSGDITTNTDGAGNLIPAALNPTTVTITSAPTKGSATVDPTTGDITYTATGINADGSAQLGADTLSYTVTDSAGHTSAPTTVTVNVIAAPQTDTIGAGSKVKAIEITQPDGSRGRFAVSGAAAIVTFSPGALTITHKGGTDFVTGAGATIAKVTLTNTAKNGPVVSLNGIGKGNVTLGDVTDLDKISQLIVANATLAGTVSATSIKRLDVTSASGATITETSPENVATVASIGTAVNTSLTVGALTSLTSKSWTITDGGAHSVMAAAIGTLNVTGAFADALTVTASTGYAITTANVAGASGVWDVTGAVRKATLTKPTSAYELQDQSVVQTLKVIGDLTGNVIAAAIDDMTVSGAMTGATIQTDALFNAADTQLLKLSIGGAITNSVIASSGNIGTITAKSLTASRIYAGATNATIQDDALPTSVDALTADANIKSVALSAGKDTFSSSEIAAYTIARLALGQVTVANGTTGFGVSAHTLASLTAALNPGGGLVLTKAQTKSAATLAAYLSKHKKTLEQFIIQLY